MSKLLLPTPPLTISTSIHSSNTLLLSSASALQFQCRSSLPLFSRPHYPLTIFHSHVRTTDLSLRAFDSTSSDANSERVKIEEKEDGVDDQSVRITDEDYPSGEFKFEPITGWRSFLVKLKMLVAFPWERVRKGSVLTMKLRGQVRFSPHSPLSLHTNNKITTYSISLLFFLCTYIFRNHINQSTSSWLLNAVSI